MKNPNNRGLPWSNNEDTDILIPCRICRKERIGADLYCEDCLKNKLTEIILRGAG